MAENVPQPDVDMMSADVETPNEPDLSTNAADEPSGVDESAKDVSSRPSEGAKDQSGTRNKEGYIHLDSNSKFSVNLDRLGKAALRFGNRKPAVPSPQLEDTFQDGEVIDLVSSPPTDFRIILCVRDYKMEEVCIDFNENTMGIRLAHEERKLSTGVTGSRDSCYYFLLPETVPKDSLSAQWTRDDFLVIQSRRYKQQEEVETVERLIPVRVGDELHPKPDFGDMKMLAKAIVWKIAEINGYLGLRCRKPQEGKPFRLIPSHLKKEKVCVNEFEEFCKI